ncbi:medium-chain-fatty-acid--CoA ligase [Burkholderia pseudomallei]|uniref:fatty acid--CoA ligase n=1 Tax=Burkholderia pseudomallei TaxID=28450 RepID=UPI000F0944E4|nr:fatty acid--CoA ligase [Burkholderia pseudomallei]CAJ3885610.1 medium-chain-fatty-acid--CoA ligase [Burkholderia pseudomallei]CAJ7011205.1 medium-chain-fatty-acid--CoA ligase [Burkholderia pseudomallei]CAJ9596835.1 medium-chain-fatty-acid--CoA ligase [Burkholderia pseudomallei]VBM03824.1 medium-chain-fatty-acid--CoA ligase [Burkholderia pseudomallei]
MHATDQHPALNAAPSAYVYPLLVGQLLTHARGADAGRQIVYRGDVRHSYAQFRERIGRLAGALAALGVGADATVAVMDWDSHRYLESYFAIPMMGATLFTVNVRLSPRQIAHTLRDARASVVVAHADFLPLLEQVRDALGDSTCVIVACDGGAMPATSLPLAGEYERLVAAADPDYPFADFDENARAVLFYTTGTTGDPKGVCYSHRQIVLHALATAAALGAARDGQRLHRDDVYMPITPMFHVMAWGMPYIAVMLGLKIVLPGRYRAHALLDLRQAERVTFSHCVPAVLQMLLDEARLRACDLSGWKMIVGGSALPASLCRAARARRIDVFAGYGMSETGPVVALAQLRGTEGGVDVHADEDAGIDADVGAGIDVDTDVDADINADAGANASDSSVTTAAAHADDETAKRCAAGWPPPLVELRVVDAAMRDVPRDGRPPGEIVLRGPALALGYRGNPQASAALWAGGYLHTQDVAVMHGDGAIRIVDRIKDVIKTGGEWVSSLELEGLLNDIAGIRESAVIGVPDARWGERPAAVVVCERGAPLAAQDVRARLLEHVAANRISRYAVPECERIVFVDALPKTSVGKIDKKSLRRLVERID